MKPRVLVTRDEPPGGALATALARVGLETISCPVVREAEPHDAAPLARAAADLERYDWLIVASRRGVESLMRARGGRALPRALRTAAVGEATAEALAAHGATDPVVGREAGARGLVAALGVEGWNGRRVLLPRAEAGSGEIAAALRAAGATADEVIAYRTVETSPAEVRGRWPSPDPDAVVLASPSAARALVAALGVPALARVPALVAIGPTTAVEIARAGLVALMPRRTTFADVAELVAEVLAGEHGSRAAHGGPGAAAARSAAGDPARPGATLPGMPAAGGRS